MSLLNTAVAIFTICNPLGNLPIYLSFTDGEKRHDRAIARSAAFTFVVAMLLAFFLGDALLGFLGISRGAFQAAGGVIVLLIGLSMFRSESHKEHHDPKSVKRDHGSTVKGVVPMGIPLLAGPGTLTVVIADPHAAQGSGRLALSVVVLALAVIAYVIFALGDLLAAKISVSALQVLTKVIGLLLTSIAVQMLFRVSRRLSLSWRGVEPSFLIYEKVMVDACWPPCVA